jgi:two-component system, NarL family, invasion response regulator UvrY
MLKTNIALVDDHIMLRNGLTALINDMEPFQVILEADNGLDFTKKILSTKIQPDIILLDINMPVMNGFTTAEWIKEHLPFSKILVLSMLDDEASIIRMLRLNARGFILKDGEPELLEAALLDLVHHDYHFNEIVSNRLVHCNKNNEFQITSILNQLTTRELAFLTLCCSEATYKEIAATLNVSPRTVDGYRDQLFEKLELKSRVGLVLFAIKNNIFNIHHIN